MGKGVLADADIVLAIAGGVAEGVATVGDTAILVEVSATVGARVAFEGATEGIDAVGDAGIAVEVASAVGAVVSVGSDSDPQAIPADTTNPIMISPTEMQIQPEARVTWIRFKTRDAINCHVPKGCV